MVTTAGELKPGWIIAIGGREGELTARVTRITPRWRDGNPAYEVYVDALSWPLIMPEDARVIAYF